MKISDPEKGVEIAKTLFNPETRTNFNEDRVVYLSQMAKVRFGNGERMSVKVTVDPAEEETRVPDSLLPLLSEGGKIEFENGLKIDLGSLSVSDIPDGGEIIL